VTGSTLFKHKDHSNNVYQNKLSILTLICNSADFAFYFD